MPTTLEQRGARAPGEVWADYVRPSRWPRWAPQITAVRGLSDPVRPTDAGVVTACRAIPVPVQVLAREDRVRRWSWLVGPWPRVRMDHYVRAEPDGGSCAGVTIHAPAALVALYRPLATAALARLCARQ